MLKIERLSVFSLLFALTACETDASGGWLSGAVPTPPAISTPFKGAQATPTPRVLLPPKMDSPPPVATPAPPAPIPPVTPTPKPISPDPGRARSSGEPDETSSPSSLPRADDKASNPLSSDAYRVTGEPLDISISGSAYFVLSTRETPKTSDDLLFTRYGHFRLQREVSGLSETWRLRHADLGLYVAGLAAAFGASGSPTEDPEENTQATGIPMGVVWAESTVPILAWSLDAGRNVDAETQTRFDHTGLARVRGQMPRSSDSKEMRIYLPLMDFETPKGLMVASGTAHVYRYSPAAGQARLGIAVTGLDRPLGNRHLLLTGRLETFKDDGF
ncbi:MAG: hypothetical protein VKN33_00035 [Candidatus Sericytochromatia bacterium]|nr:hypothetical protein [Candidatus Sericytochromatia bacterium]